MNTLDGDGIIEIDTERGLALGLSSADFASGTYLWRKGDVIIVSFIETKRKGAFRELANRILTLGMTVHVPTPLAEMERIVRKAGYTQLWIEDEHFGEAVEVWELKPKEPVGA